jgi:ABC-type dipeptide/oligopeptide/nickel transport system permease subunit
LRRERALMIIARSRLTMMLAPATTIVVTTLAASVIGDWLRDRLDPTLQ